MTQECRNCAYLGGDGRLYECRRHPPQIAIKREYDSTAINTVTCWPNVCLSQWCGHYSAASKKKLGVRR